MRKLTASQKKVIDRAMIADSNLRSWDDLPYEVIEEIIRINNTEVLWSETNRYMHDQFWSKLNASHSF